MGGFTGIWCLGSCYFGLGFRFYRTFEGFGILVVPMFRGVFCVFPRFWSLVGWPLGFGFVVLDIWCLSVVCFILGLLECLFWLCVVFGLVGGFTSCCVCLFGLLAWLCFGLMFLFLVCACWWLDLVVCCCFD